MDVDRAAETRRFELGTIAAGGLLCAAGGLSLLALTRGHMAEGAAADLVEGIEATIANPRAFKADSSYLPLFRSGQVHELSPFETTLPDGARNRATFDSYFDLRPPVFGKQSDLVNFVRTNGQVERVDSATQIGAWNGKQFVFHDDTNISAVRRSPFAFSLIDHSNNSTSHFLALGSDRARVGYFTGDDMQFGTTSVRNMRRTMTEQFYSAENVPLGKRLGQLQDANPA